MIHYKDEKSDYHQLLSLNKTCKFCPSCELIITKKSEIESYLEEMLTRWGKTTFHAENYLVFGTIDRSVWKAGKQNSLNPQDALKLAAPFKHVWEFKVTSPGWYFDGEK
jgi:hypothetical protein